MFLRLVSLLLLSSIVFAVDFPGRLSAEEAAELRKTCGRRPSNPDVHFVLKSFASRFTNRTEAPWVTSDGALISKRHVLTCAHCVPWLGKSSTKHLTVKLSMACKRSNNLKKCTEKPIIERKVAEITYHENYYRGFGMTSDIAVLTLEKDIEMSELVYPACLGGCAVDKNETLTNYGFGGSTDEEIAKGIDKAGFLQIFKTTRVRKYRKDATVLYGIDPVGAHSMRGDSGSGYYHTNNGITSVYAVNDGRTDFGRASYATRVSAHLYWINYVTGIDARDEDMEFSAYLYPLKMKDNRKKETFYAGASNPSRIV